VYYVFIRGKIKFVYDCEFSLKIKGIKHLEGSELEVKISEINNHTLDDDFEVRRKLKNLVRFFKIFYRRFKEY